MKVIKIKDWAFIVRGGAYQPPELLTEHLSGEVYNHPNKRFPDGKRVVTSRIIHIDLIGRAVQTKNNKYHLEGPPEQKWLDWVRESGLEEKYKILWEERVVN